MAYYDWENKEKLIEDLKASASISNFLDNQGLVASSGNYDTFKKWMKKHEINKDDYLTEPLVKEMKPKKEVRKLTIEQIFTENSEASRDLVRRNVISNKLVEYKCSGCGNCGSWNGIELSLQLEHKNGNSTDNRVENLEFLCPNCHSQTHTYGSKNKHNRIFEQRIKDLEIYNNKVLGYHNFIELAEKWKNSTEAVKNWIKAYGGKIEENGIQIHIEEYIPHHSHLSHETIKDRHNDLTSAKLDTDWKDTLSKKWNISAHAARKWIKENDYDFFKINYELTPSRKAKIHLEDKKVNIAKLLEGCKNNNKFDIDLFIPLLGNSKASTIAYLRRVFTEDYNFFHPIALCKYCNSSKTQRSGLKRLKKGNFQKYHCLDCSKQFY
jgi:Zn finger protein HypA/HybF involved in hydrogenase expression